MCLKLKSVTKSPFVIIVFIIILRMNYSEGKYYKYCDVKNCLCSYNEETNRYYLYCNDPNLTRIPDFSVGNRSRLVFAKLDFSNSNIERITSEDLKHLKLDISNGNSSSETITEKLKTETFETVLEHLKKNMPPAYHLDFDNVNHIESGAFRDLVINSFKLISKRVGSNYLRLNMRFKNSRFNYTARDKPFHGLIAKELHLKNISDSFLMESIFGGSVISELIIENSRDLTGFLVIDSNVSTTGILLHKLKIFKSFNGKHLTANMLPSFVKTLTFSEIMIKNCKSLEHLNGFTFSQYPYLKTLYLTSNNFKTMDRYSFQGLSSLEILDMSFNPLQAIEEDTFSECKRLKYLHLQSTHLRIIQRNSFRGLFSLIRLKLGRTRVLETIEGRAFEDSKRTLKELNFKDSSINLVEEFQKDTGVDPPYSRDNDEQALSDFWLEGLNLTLLTIDLMPRNDSIDRFDNYTKSFLICKIMHYLSNTTLVHLPRDQECDSLVYFVYRRKSFDIPNWEHHTPICYRSEITLDDDVKSFRKIEKKEKLYSFNLLNIVCYKIRIISTTRETVNFAIGVGEVHTIPKIDFIKLMYVTLVLLGLTALFIFFLRFIYRIKNKLEEMKKKRLGRSNVLRKSSSSSSNNINFNLIDATSSKKSLILLPPSVIPKFSTRAGKQKNQPKMMPNISKLMIKESNYSNSTFDTVKSRQQKFLSTKSSSQSSIGKLPNSMASNPPLPGKINIRKHNYSHRSNMEGNSFNNSELESLQGIREDAEVYGTEI